MAKFSIKQLEKKCDCLKAVHKKLRSKKAKNVKKAVDSMSDEAIDTICQLIQNLIYRNVGIPNKKLKSILKILEPQSKKMLYLSNKSNSIKRKRNIIKQEGGAIGAVIARALPTLISLISTFLSK